LLLAFGVLAILLALLFFQVQTGLDSALSVYLFFLPLVVVSFAVAILAVRKIMWHTPVAIWRHLARSEAKPYFIV
jgi:hypothetical protein